MPRKTLDEICRGCWFAKKCICPQDHVTGCMIDTPNIDREAGTCTNWLDRNLKVEVERQDMAQQVEETE